LYLREDIEIKCNITMISFVKSQMKAASKILVERLIKKAELLDSGVLKAMMDNGKLKTINPADRTNTMDANTFPPNSPQFNNPQMSYHQSVSYRPGSQQYLQPGQGSYHHQQQQQQPHQAVMELPADQGYYNQDHSMQLPSYNPHPGHSSYHSQMSGTSPALSQSHTWQGASRPSSYSSEPSKYGHPAAPPAELPAHPQEAPPLPAKDYRN